MICYKDRTWCSVYTMGACSNNTCYGAFTYIDREKAIKWWGGRDFPISLANMKTEICGYIPSDTGDKNDGR